MSRWLPGDPRSAYQRWQIPSFDEPTPDAAARPADPPRDAEVTPEPAGEVAGPPHEPPAGGPTAEECTRLRREAEAAGYAAGYTEGLAATQAATATIATLLDGLRAALAAIDQQVADSLLALAIEIANQVLRQSLRVHPELILPVVREAISALHPHHGQPLLFLHPDDAMLVRSQLGEQLAHGHWRIVDDSALTAGGCRVELAASEVDATLETRWRRVIEAIGVNQEWLDGQP